MILLCPYCGSPMIFYDDHSMCFECGYVFYCDWEHDA